MHLSKRMQSKWSLKNIDRGEGVSSPFPRYFEKLDIAITKTLFQFASNATGKCDLPIMWTMTFSSNNFLFASHVLINLSLIPAIQFGSYSFVHWTFVHISPIMYHNNLVYCFLGGVFVLVWHWALNIFFLILWVVGFWSSEKWNSKIKVLHSSFIS